MPTARTCTVSFTDSEGISHSVEVTASSLYEAAVLALAEFRRAGFAAVTPGPGTRLKVEVKAPVTTHELSVGKLTVWLEGSGRSPAEQALKVRLRAIVQEG